jgi:DNA-binding transcriptional LysR family regulator
VATGKDLDCPKEINIKNIDQRAWVQFLGEYHQFDKALDLKVKEYNIKLNSVFESSNVGTIKRVIESGLGWGFLPSHSIRKQVKLGRMTKVHVNDFQHKVEICFYNESQAKQKDLIDFLFQSVSSHDRS